MAPLSNAGSLRLIKLLHSLVWAVFAGCIIAIPILAWQRQMLLAGVLIAVVLVEVLVLAANRGRCPLTDVAARYTEDRSSNFDIYLPEWLARHNKLIFGSLYLLGVVLTILHWASTRGLN